MSEAELTSTGAAIRDAGAADFQAILGLNAGSEQLLSPLDAQLLERLHGQSAYHRVSEAGGTVVAFLLALRDGADYGSPNYRWFAARYPSFLYIDRVVVDPAHRGSGVAAALYDDLFGFVRKIGVTTVTCEFYIEPPNEISRRFHARFGFREVSTQWCYGKRVSLQECSVFPR